MLRFVSRWGTIVCMLLEIRLVMVSTCFIPWKYWTNGDTAPAGNTTYKSVDPPTPVHPHLKKFNRTWFFQSPLENCKNSIVFCFFSSAKFKWKFYRKCCFFNRKFKWNFNRKVCFFNRNWNENSIENFVFQKKIMRWVCGGAVQPMLHVMWLSSPCYDGAVQPMLWWGCPAHMLWWGCPAHVMIGLSSPYYDGAVQPMLW